MFSQSMISISDTCVSAADGFRSRRRSSEISQARVSSRDDRRSGLQSSSDTRKRRRGQIIHDRGLQRFDVLTVLRMQRASDASSIEPASVSTQTINGSTWPGRLARPIAWVMVLGTQSCLEDVHEAAGREVDHFAGGADLPIEQNLLALAEGFDGGLALRRRRPAVEGDALALERARRWRRCTSWWYSEAITLRPASSSGSSSAAIACSLDDAGQAAIGRRVRDRSRNRQCLLAGRLADVALQAAPPRLRHSAVILSGTTRSSDVDRPGVDDDRRQILLHVLLFHPASEARHDPLEVRRGFLLGADRPSRDRCGRTSLRNSERRMCRSRRPARAARAAARADAGTARSADRWATASPTTARHKARSPAGRRSRCRWRRSSACAPNPSTSKHAPRRSPPGRSDTGAGALPGSDISRSG